LVKVAALAGRYGALAEIDQRRHNTADERSGEPLFNSTDSGIKSAKAGSPEVCFLNALILLNWHFSIIIKRLKMSKRIALQM